jgi:DNA-binding protein H-NS
MKGAHTALAGQPQWEQFRPLVVRAMFESRIVNGRETNPIGTKEIAQLFRQLPSEERRRIKEEVDKLSQAGIEIKQTLRNYIYNSLGADLLSAKKKKEAQPEKTEEAQPILYDAYGRPTK